VRYVRALLDDDATEVQIRDEYNKKYERHPPLEQLDASRAPHFGSDEAPIKLVEFLDYECPHCALFRTALEQVLADKAGKVEVFVMMFPLEQRHPEAKSAAQAALAASAQGKFKEMHELLFAQTPKHSRDEVTGYAKDLGLDLDRFAAAYDAAERHVASDVAQGNIAGVDATPTLFFNDRKYEGPMNAKYLELWIDEELALK
jgi:protein-disulfide isomerase